MTTVSRTMTIEQFAAYAAEHGRCELIRGEVFDLSPTGESHGRITSRLHWRIASFVESNRRGEVYTAETGFRLDDDGSPTVRAPDIAFITAARAAAAASKSFCPIAPDLVVETLSPEDRVGEVADKVRWWLGHGVRAVWTVDPGEKVIVVHATGEQTRWLTVNDTLDGGGVLPGFSCRIADIFA